MNKMNYKRVSLLVLFISALLMFLLCFFLIRSFAQVTLLGTMKVDTVKYDYWSKLQPLLDKYTFDKKQDGSIILFIPLSKVFGDTSISVMFYNLEFYPYAYNSKNEKVTLIEPTDVTIIEYNLKNHKWKKAKYKHDTFNDFKEKDTEKLKDKIKEKEKKPKGKQL